MTASTISLSLAMIARNEARCLARCLRSVQAIVDEIVLVDTGSTDDTVRLAREFNARVVPFVWVDDFAAARNHALEHSTGNWVLVLDADEHASATLSAEIARFIQGQSAIGRLKIVSDFRQNGQTLRSQSFVSRLFPRGARFEGRIHEQLVSPLPRLNLKGELWHDGYLEKTKTDRNVNLLRRELEREPDSAYLLYQLALEYTSLDRTAEAFQCLRNALASMKPGDPFGPNVVVDFLYAAIRLQQFDAATGLLEKVGSSLDDFPDFHLAGGLFYMNLVRSNPSRYLSELPRIEQCFRRCLALGETDRYRSVRGSGSFLANYNLGLFYHVFGNLAAARQCFKQAAHDGYEPAEAMLRQISG